MLSRTPLRHWLLAGGIAAAAALAATALLNRPAEAQGVMSAPGCQCSPATPIAGLSSSIAHCICGAMSCAITEHKPAPSAAGTALMQCVR